MKKKKLIILAAGEGTRLRPFTNNLPKCMVPLAGKTLIDWKIEMALNAGITADNIIIVGGYLADKIQYSSGTLLVNAKYAETNMVRTLWCAREHFGQSVIVVYGDIVYTEDVFAKVLSCQDDIGVVVDHNWCSYWQRRFTDILSDAESLKLDDADRITSIGQPVGDISEIDGQYIGLMVFQGGGIKALDQLYEKELRCFQNGLPGMASPRNLDDLYMTDMLQGLIDQGALLREISINGGWVEIDSPADLELAQSLCSNNLDLLEIVKNYAY